MPPYKDSRLIRSAGRASERLAYYGRCSLTGRGLSGFTHATGRWAGASLTFRTTNIQSLPLDSPGQSVAAATIGKAYTGLHSALSEGVPGRMSVRWHQWAGLSAFRAAEWTRPLGATLLGMACGLAVRSVVVTSIILAVLGLLLLWGPFLLMASSHSLVLGRLWFAKRSGPTPESSVAAADRSKRTVYAASALCLLSGAAAALVDRSGPLWLAGGAALVALAVVIVWRVEVTLLIAAAFPWIDVLIRAALDETGAIWDEAFLLVSVMLLLWGALVSGRLRLRTVPITVPVLFVLLAAVGSVVVRGVPGDVGLYGIRVILEPLLFYFMGFLLLTSTRWLRAVVGMFLASTTALALHGISQTLMHVETPREWLDPSETGIVTRAFSVVGKPNELGAVLAIGILVTLAIILTKGTRARTRLGLGVMMAAQLVALGMTFSRSAMLGLVCGLFAMLILAYRRYLMPTLTLGVVGALAAPRSLWDRFFLVFSSGYLQRAAIDGRTYRWILALDQIGAHPLFGVGMGMFGATSATKYGYWDKWIDNTYLQMGAEGGLLLLAAFLWLLLRIAKGLVKGYRTAEDPFVRALAAGMFGAMIAIGVTNIFLSSLEKLPVSVGLWLLAGMTTSAALGLRTESSK